MLNNKGFDLWADNYDRKKKKRDVVTFVAQKILRYCIYKSIWGELSC